MNRASKSLELFCNDPTSRWISLPMIVDDIARFLDQFAPADLAESWDNVGLLAGDRGAPVSKVMTCLTITPASAEEAISARAELIVTHHPLPFRPLRRLTTDTPEGRLLCDLLAARIAIYSPHTAFDSTTGGINERLAKGLGLVDLEPLVVLPESAASGVAAGPRCGQARGAVAGAAPRPARPATHWQSGRGNSCGLGKSKRSATPAGLRKKWPWRAVVPANSWRRPMPRAASYLSPAKSASILAWRPKDSAWRCWWSVILPASALRSRFWPTCLAKQFPSVSVWASRHESDPLRWL